MPLAPPINLTRWIEEHRALLKPPVGNKMIWQDSEFMVMAVGGPNARKDFHVEEGEEFFYQVEGDITLRIIEDGKLREIPIRQGERFLPPPATQDPPAPRDPAPRGGVLPPPPPPPPPPPAPPANPGGLVIERRRAAG